jgi:hypothetical protein
VNKNLKEFRFTFSDGVIRYATILEIVNSEFSFIVGQLSELEAINESNLGLYNGELYIKDLVDFLIVSMGYWKRLLMIFFMKEKDIG